MTILRPYFLSLFLLLTSTLAFESYAANSRCLAAKFKLRSQLEQIIDEDSGSLEKAIRKLHPGQYIVGEARVLQLIHKMRKMDYGELKDMLKEKPIPYVQGPDNSRWMVDRHHMLYALNRIYDEMVAKGVPMHKLKVQYKIVDDFSDMPQAQFLKTMEQRGLLYPYRMGGRRDLNNIPSHIGDLQYEYYRGLAWILEEVGAITKQDTPFFEFYWGQYLERKLNLARRNYSRASVQKAIGLVTAQKGEHVKFPGHVKDPYEVGEYMDEVDEILEIINKMKAKGY